MNKNTRFVKRQLRLAARRGESSIVIQVPVRNFHSAQSSQRFVNKTYHVSSGNSRNTKRNMQQRVLKNSGAGAGTLTIHEPIDKERPVDFKNHKYLKEDKHFSGYKQPYEKVA